MKGVLVVFVAALLAAPSALAARAAEPRPQAPGLLSIGAYNHALVQLSGGTLAAEGGTLVSRRLGIWRLPTRTAERMLPRLLDAGVVRAVEPDQPARPLRATQTDPLIGLEWWRSAVGADSTPPPGPGQPITIIDAGLDVTHEEFAARPNTFLLTRQSLTDTPEEFHGTAVSSVAAAPENGVGLVGVYPQAVLREADAHQLTVSQIIAALEAALNAGPSVINLSLGVSDRSNLLEDEILTAFRTGSIVVAAVGNERQIGSPPSYPAPYRHVLTVAATDETNRVATFSSASEALDLSAPGVRIPVAVPLSFTSTGYQFLNGTSFAAPIVTGATAWVWTARPDLHYTQVFDLMRYSARDIAEKGFDRDTGFGLLNIPAALTQEAPSSDGREPNDDIRMIKANGLFQNATDPITRPGKTTASFRARLDPTEDPEDVYRLYVPPARTVRVTVTLDTDVDVDLWKPSAGTVFLRGAARTRNLFASSRTRGKKPEKVSVRNTSNRGFYAYLDVYLPKARAARAEYRVSVSTARR
ncbi:MAG TPA: S8 family serine peptidase [Gaiellaceae bacterium]|nr:S8 family serine peptidase [Gaiellaceae bacterium]